MYEEKITPRSAVIKKVINFRVASHIPVADYFPLNILFLTSPS